MLISTSTTPKSPNTQERTHHIHTHPLVIAHDHPRIPQLILLPQTGCALRNAECKGRMRQSIGEHIILVIIKPMHLVPIGHCTMFTGAHIGVSAWRSGEHKEYELG
jgi:hypothetical protein